MGRIITIGSSKGGVGKTTLVNALAEFLKRRGASVFCIDADPNKNLSGWLAATGMVEFAVVQADDLVQVANEVSTSHDFVLVDVPGANSTALVNAIDISSLVLIPTKADAKDVVEAFRTYQHVVNAITKARRFSPKAHIPAAAVLSQVDRRASVDQIARKQLEGLSIPTLKADLGLKASINHASFAQKPAPYSAMGDDIEAIGAEALALLETFRG
ncbi:ParA family protein [Azospirillum aestuarii]|uniref:ParA family protein n=1 Tax=Azospirillum aestuarii TaxID=2802052 RepID=UPI0040552EF9